MANVVLTSGRRKTSVARAKVVKGKGSVLINNQPLEKYVSNEALQLRVKEPFVLSGLGDKYDFSINVFGGGQNSQVDAVRQAVARALVEITGKSDLKKKYLDYDRSLLVSDTRFKETNKPNTSQARAKRQKSYRWSQMVEEMQNKKTTGYIKVKCHECGNEQVIYGKAATEVKCLKCSAVIAIPTGGKASVKAEILELL